jgi:predicted permease
MVFIIEAIRSLRSLTRAPGLCVVAVSTLALAIGGAGGLFSLLDAVVLRSLPVQDPSRLVAVFPANGEALFGITMPTLARFRDTQQMISGVCGVAPAGAITVDVRGANVPRTVESVTGDCAEVLGIHAAVGRLITPEDAPLSGSGAQVVVLGNRFWRDNFNADTGAVGQALRIEGKPLTIVGVLPDSYRGLNADEEPDVLMPIETMWQLRGGGGRALATQMVGRLRDGITLDVARTQLPATWAAAWAATNPAGLPPAATRAGQPENFKVQTLANGFSTLRGRFTQPLQAAIALAVLLALLAAINVGALLLARTVAHEQHIAVQLALGASRARLAFGVFVEGVCIAIAGALLAVPIAFVVARFVASLAWTGSRPLTMVVTPSLPTFIAITVAAFAAGLIVSLGPVVVILLREFRITAARSVFGTTRRWRSGLVVSQVAMSFALLFCAALFSTSLAGMRGQSLGYVDDGLRWSRLELIFGVPRTYDADAYFRAVVDRVSALPGVESGALSVGFPTTELRQITALFPIEVPGGGATAQGTMDRISPGFFKTTGAALLRGREFTWSDSGQAPPVAIITQPLADRLFPGGDGLGRQVRIPGRKPQDLTIVGISADFSPGDPRILMVPRVYVPMMQDPATGSAPVVLLRVNRDDEVLTPLRAAVAGLGRHNVPALRTIEQQVDRALTQERLLSAIAVAFGVVGALLGALGLYALLAHAVARRTRELGLRMALGATRNAIHSLVVGEGVRLVLIGAAAGIPLALGAGLTARALLYETSPFDARLLAATTVMSLTIAATAALIPAARAGRTDPAVSLRAE